MMPFKRKNCKDTPKCKKGKKCSKQTENRKEQKRVSMRKYREKLKEDPKRQEEEKAKERDRYHKRKQVVDEMSERIKRSVRKKWKMQKRKQRQKSKEQEISKQETLNIAKELDSSPSVPSTSRSESGRKRAKKNSARLRKENMKLEEEKKALARKLEKYKKRLKRFRDAVSNNSSLESPRKKIKRLVVEKNQKKLEKKALFGEAIKEQIKLSFKEEKSRKKRKDVIKVLTGKILRKYKYLEDIRSVTSKKIGRASIPVYNNSSKEGNLRSSKVQLAVQKFLQSDEASRICAGKKETITQRGKKMQKRFLNNTLRNLVPVFKQQNPCFNNISYRTFCRYKPFWVLYPKVKDRETCLCKPHENMELIVKALNSSKVIKERTTDDVVRTLCCEERRRECLERCCKICNNRMLQTIIENEEAPAEYHKWVTNKCPAIIKGKETIVQRTIKIKILTTKQQLYETFCEDIPKFMVHISNMYHQQNQIREIKERLSPGDMLLHFDFSENYVCKYGREIQSTHFGASKQQVTIHTAVLYCHGEEPKCFATVSDCNRHDPSAVLAHLTPLVNYMKVCVPKLKRIHFLSDGAPTQYKNKKMFYLFLHRLTKQLMCDEINWNFCESGHGKGAADGVGATLKRTADKLVAMGTDLPTSESLVTILKENCQGITVLTVNEEDIHNVDLIIPETIKTFKGTSKIHQVRWTKNSTVLQARRLTCLKCHSSCSHFGLGVIDMPLKSILLKLH